MAFLTLRDGGHLKYEDKGSGPPIVLLHGWGMRGRYFEPQVAALAHRYRIVVPDFRGHGESTPLEEGHGLHTLVDDTVKLIAALDLSHAMVVGWSMGAMVSWGLMGGAEANRIAALVTIDMVPKLLNEEDWQFGLRAGADSSVFSGIVDRMLTDWPGFTRIFVPRIFARGGATQLRAAVDRMISETEKNHPASMARLWLSMANQDFRNQLVRIDIPCLVAYGALSQLYREAASEWVISQLPNATGVRFADSGHAPHLEEPDHFNTEIDTFAQRARSEPLDGAEMRKNYSS